MAINSLSTGFRPGVCTSSTRPTAPYEGQQIYETDTDLLRIWNGSAWVSNPSTFTTEALRDASITSPSEGMIAYLTAPTVPAATGGDAAVPTGIVTVYNGSVWVCTTTVGTGQSGSSQTATASAVDITIGGVTPTVTLVTGTTALVSMNCNLVSVGNYTRLTVKTGSVASNSKWWAFNVSNSTICVGRTFVMTGLTAGTNTFTLQLQSNVVDASNAADVFLAVSGIA